MGSVKLHVLEMDSGRLSFHQQVLMALRDIEELPVMVSLHLAVGLWTSHYANIGVPKLSHGSEDGNGPYWFGDCSMKSGLVQSLTLTGFRGFGPGLQMGSL